MYKNSNLKQIKMKKLFYVFAVAFMGLVVACGNANNSNTAEETVVEETVERNSCCK